MNGQNGFDRFVILRAPKARAKLRPEGAAVGANPSLSSLLRPRATARAAAGARGAAPEADRTADAALDALAEARVVAATLSRGDAADLARDPDVIAASRSIPIRMVRPLSATRRAKDSAIPPGDAWGIAAVGADRPGAPTGKGVRVAILDSGIEADHPAFAGMTLTLRDFTKTPPEADAAPDGNGHGTHCAGTIFGRDVGGVRIGVARGVKRAFVGRVLGDDGSGGSEALFAGMNWAFENKAHVLSVSIGFDFPELVERLKASGLPSKAATSVALEFYGANLRMFDTIMGVAQARVGFGPGTVVVAATGNESNRPRFEIAASVPAAANDVLGVGALGRSPAGLSVARFSNTGPDVCAPGVDVLSAALGGGLRVDSGTSMATPHVAGLAALHWEAALAGDADTKAETVTSLLVAGATTTGLDPVWEPQDRGRGLARAP